jgi:hypothetical protein
MVINYRVRAYNPTTGHRVTEYFGRDLVAAQARAAELNGLGYQVESIRNSI